MIVKLLMGSRWWDPRLMLMPGLVAANPQAPIRPHARPRWCWVKYNTSLHKFVIVEMMTPYSLSPLWLKYKAALILEKPVKLHERLLFLFYSITYSPHSKWFAERQLAVLCQSGNAATSYLTVVRKFTLSIETDQYTLLYININHSINLLKWNDR